MSEAFFFGDVQGNILRGYKRNFVRHLILEVGDSNAARGFLGASARGGNGNVPAITYESEKRWSQKPDVCFNIGVTYEGLKALGAPTELLATFPTEFTEGMTSRALKLGDFGSSSPENWPAPFDKPARVHLVASVYADDQAHLDRIQAQVAKAFVVTGVRCGRNLAPDPGDPSGVRVKVFFDYTDNISQPRFAGVHDAAQAKVDEPIDPPGTVLLGYDTSLEGLRFRVPISPEVGRNGSFNAFRVLAQNARAFEDYLDRAARELIGHSDVDQLLAPGEELRFGPGFDYFRALREVVAAQMCGRWRNGAPLANAPDWPDPKANFTNFDYNSSSPCPVGSHIRRANPRGGPVVQRIAKFTRRLVRRGMSYGPEFDPKHPDDQERGLLGNFIGASLGAQFEAVMYDWINLGLLDPDITGSNDPVIGANAPETSWFDLRLKTGGSIRLRGFPRFVTTRGGAYTFLPSRPAIEYLSQLTD